MRVNDTNMRIRRGIRKAGVEVDDAAKCLGYSDTEFDKVLNRNGLTLLQVLQLADFVGWNNKEILETFFLTRERKPRKCIKPY